jgi:hypothetical protein
VSKSEGKAKNCNIENEETRKGKPANVVFVYDQAGLTLSCALAVGENALGERPTKKSKASRCEALILFFCISRIFFSWNYTLHPTYDSFASEANSMCEFWFLSRAISGFR